MSTLRQQVSNCPYAAIYLWPKAEVKIQWKENNFSGVQIYILGLLHVPGFCQKGAPGAHISRKQSHFFPGSTPAIWHPTQTFLGLCHAFRPQKANTTL